MYFAVLPRRMIFVRIQPPPEDEACPVLVDLLLLAHGPGDRFGEVAIRLISAFIGRLRLLRVRLYPWKWHSALALRCLASAALQFPARHLWMDFRHRCTPSVSEQGP